MKPALSSSDDRRLEAELKAVAEARSRSLTEHPSPDELLDYHLGVLPGEEAELVQEHLSFCHECSQVVLDLVAFSRPPAGESERPAAHLDREWDRLEARRKAEVRHTPVVAMGHRRLPWALLAASLVALLSLTIWNLALREGLRRPDQPRTDVGMVSLTPDRPAGERSAEGLTPVRVRPGQRTILLLLNLGDLRTFPNYRLVLVEPRKGVLWEESGVSRNDDGTFLLEIPARMLESKTYRVSLFGQPDGDRVPLANYSFEVIRGERSR